MWCRRRMQRYNASAARAATFNAQAQKSLDEVSQADSSTTHSRQTATESSATQVADAQKQSANGKEEAEEKVASPSENPTETADNSEQQASPRPLVSSTGPELAVTAIRTEAPGEASQRTEERATQTGEEVASLPNADDFLPILIYVIIKVHVMPACVQ